MVKYKTELVPAMTETTPKRRILVVDDEPGLRRLLAYEFQFRGYETVTAETADEALKILREQKAPFDLIVTDIRMPGSMDGIDLIEKKFKKRVKGKQGEGRQNQG